MIPGASLLASPALPLIAALGMSVLVQIARKRDVGPAAVPNTLVSVALWITGPLLFAGAAGDILAAGTALYDRLGIPRLPASVWTGIPGPLALLILVVSHDFCDYWNHRFMHLRWVFPVHAVHHSDTHVDGLTTFRVHALEWVVMQISYVLLMSWMSAPELPAATLWFLILLHNCYVHLDLDWTHGPFRYVLASQRFHRWHHADVEFAYGKNLANLFPIFDRMFGTYLDPGPCTAPLGGRQSGIPSTNLPRLLLWPVIGWGRLVRETLARQTHLSGADGFILPGK